MKVFPVTLLERFRPLKVSHKNGLSVSHLQGGTCGVWRLGMSPARGGGRDRVEDPLAMLHISDTR